MSQMAAASAGMLKELPSVFLNFKGYFLVGEAHRFFREYMGKLNHLILNKEMVVHPTMIAIKWCDTDQQGVAIRQACIALTRATGLNLHHTNIKNYDEVLPVSAGMKRVSDERQDAAFLSIEAQMQEEQAPKERGKYRSSDDVAKAVATFLLKEEQAREEQALQRMNELEEQAQQQEEEPPKARHKKRSFEDRIEELKQYKDTYGHTNGLFAMTNP